MDSLNGIVIGGLLGNMILGQFNLSVLGIQIDVQVTNGHGRTYLPEDKSDDVKYVIITISLGSKKKTTRFKVSEGIAYITLNIINKISKVQKFLPTFKIKVKQNEPPQHIKIKVHD